MDKTTYSGRTRVAQLNDGDRWILPGTPSLNASERVTLGASTQYFELFGEELCFWVLPLKHLCYRCPAVLNGTLSEQGTLI